MITLRINGSGKTRLLLEPDFEVLPCTLWNDKTGLTRRMSFLPEMLIYLADEYAATVCTATRLSFLGDA
jgi:hypothetical protein